MTYYDKTIYKQYKKYSYNILMNEPWRSLRARNYTNMNNVYPDTSLHIESKTSSSNYPLKFNSGENTVTSVSFEVEEMNYVHYVNISHTISSFKTNCISFLNSKENNVMNGIFSNIVYSDSNAVFSGIHLKFPIKELILNTKHVDDIWKYCHFSQITNNLIIESVIKIEYDIIEYYMSYYNIRKKPIYSLKNQLKSGYFKTINDNKVCNHHILKISGVWETKNDIGLTVKIMY
jgi:hypothetical protein